MPDVTYHVNPATISKFIGGQQNTITEHLVKIAEAFKEEARKQAPVDTGYMRDHIMVRHEDHDVLVVSEADYSSYVEFGTVNQTANPFMRRAYEIVKSALHAGSLR